MNFTDKNISQLTMCSYIDQTFLKPYASDKELFDFIDTSLKYPFKSVMISSSNVKKCSNIIKDSNILLGCVIGFPSGQFSIESKLFETACAISDGADEIDYVINIGELKSGNFSYIESEMEQMKNLCRKNNALLKVIFENCYLTQDEIIKLCNISLTVRPDYIKTSTGFGTGGATQADVMLMKNTVRDAVKVKAAGGIRDLSGALKMINAGADRIGTSAGISIINQLI